MTSGLPTASRVCNRRFLPVPTVRNLAYPVQVNYQLFLSILGSQTTGAEVLAPWSELTQATALRARGAGTHGNTGTARPGQSEAGIERLFSLYGAGQTGDPADLGSCFLVALPTGRPGQVL